MGNDCKSDNIICSGSESCDHANSLTGKNLVECSGRFSCTKTDSIMVTDETVGKVECTGSNSCSQTKIESYKDIKCGGRRSCASSEIIARNDIFITGIFFYSET